MDILQYVTPVLSFMKTLATNTVAYSLIIAALVFYVYSFFNIAIPKFIVGPVIAILLFPAGYILGGLQSAETERARCVEENRKAQEQLNNKYLDLALDLKTLQARYDREKASLEKEYAEDRSELQETIRLLQEEEARSILDELETDENKPTVQVVTKRSVVYVPSNKCLSTIVPSSILQSINEAGHGSATKQ